MWALFNDVITTDGMIIIWAPSINPQASTYGSDLSQEDLQHEKEYWKPRTTFRLVLDFHYVHLVLTYSE